MNNPSVRYPEGSMNSASMATNLLGRPVRFKERPKGCETDQGSIAPVSIDQQGVHFVILVGNALIQVDSPDKFLVLD